jgi:hypothetical protein
MCVELQRKGDREKVKKRTENGIPFCFFRSRESDFLIRIHGNTTTDDKIFFCSSGGVLKKM